MAKGMPEFRIPGADVAREIKDITDIGVKLLVNSPVENVAELKKDYDAVLVTIGTSVGKKLNYLPGSNFRNVYTAVQLLKDNRLKLAVPGYEMKLDLGKKVCIIGGRQRVHRLCPYPAPYGLRSQHRLLGEGREDAG